MFLLWSITFGDIIHKSAVIDATIDTARRYAASDSNVIIVGETGTGKELFAQSIHNASPRKNGPFVAINCAALPENLLESELFGYVEGAFTGSVKGGKMGLFEQAHGGTLFLDEIGEISLSTQTKLLRVLQEREVRRIGDNKVISINVRIISATNKSINQLAGKELFRRDLMYRLDVSPERPGRGTLLQSHSPSPPRCISHYIDLFLVSFMKLLLFLADIHILGIIIALNNCIEQ